MLIVFESPIAILFDPSHNILYRKVNVFANFNFHGNDKLCIMDTMCKMSHELR